MSKIKNINEWWNCWSSFPAIAIAQEIQKRFLFRIWFHGANGKMEMEKVPAH